MITGAHNQSVSTNKLIKKCQDIVIIRFNFFLQKIMPRNQLQLQRHSIQLQSHNQSTYNSTDTTTSQLHFHTHLTIYSRQNVKQPVGKENNTHSKQ